MAQKSQSFIEETYKAILQAYSHPEEKTKAQATNLCSSNYKQIITRLLTLQQNCNQRCCRICCQEKRSIMSNPVPNKPTNQAKATITQKTTGSTVRKKSLDSQDAFMRQVSLYFVMGLCVFSETVSLLAFIFTRNVEAALIFQLPALAFFYRILCNLFPSDDTHIHPLVALVQTIWRHKP